MRRLGLGLLLSVFALPASAASIPGQAAILQGLDKVTARISTFEAPINQPVKFGSLDIVVRACNKRPVEETPESAAFIEIIEQLPGEAPKALFSGWMFASSPALNPLEHPVYDIWVTDCKTAEPAKPAPAK
ncbi:MAG: DUF2155 domain-containing protein [Alphaproteobacteria bacterium]|jgi:hypothetical protein|nr:DUF2155 domain-containing protein [Alphaproteobacteria bacterium]